MGIDGDTFKIGETVVRLFDIDAPELAQICDGGPSRLRPCGAYVADALAEPGWGSGPGLA